MALADWYAVYAGDASDVQHGDVDALGKSQQDAQQTGEAVTDQQQTEKQQEEAHEPNAKPDLQVDRVAGSIAIAGLSAGSRCVCSTPCCFVHHNHFSTSCITSAPSDLCTAACLLGCVKFWATQIVNLWATQNDYCLPV